ncbi:MAG: hypothetical protein HC786_03220 [Richelia sp. CSU_2_1]|nr:hypothetical protein [Richelia sp. CSU_2_1]
MRCRLRSALRINRIWFDRSQYYIRWRQLPITDYQKKEEGRRKKEEGEF